MTSGPSSAVSTAGDRQRTSRPTPTSRRDQGLFALLTSLVALDGIIPSAVNFWFLPHVNSDVADTAPRHELAVLASRVLVVALVAGALLVVSRKARSLRGDFGDLLCLLALPAYFMVAGLADTTLGVAEILGFAVVVLVLVAVWMLDVDATSLRTLAVCAVAVAVYSIALGIAIPNAAFFGGLDASGSLIPADKAIIGSNLLAGPFGHSNTLGVFMALTLPLAIAAWRGWRRGFAVLSMGLALLWSGSRTSMLAALVALAAMALVRLHRHRTKTVLAGMILLACWLAATCVPLLVQERTIFTRRGAIWYESRLAWLEMPVVGRGANWYSEIGAVTNDLGAQASSGHSLLLTWLVTGGLVAAAAGALVLIRLGRRSVQALADGATEGFFGFCVALAVISTLEMVWVMDASSELFFVTVYCAAVLLRSGLNGAGSDGLARRTPDRRVWHRRGSSSSRGAS